MAYNDGQRDHFNPIPGGRIARMTALEGNGHSASSDHHDYGLATAYPKTSSEEEDTPESQRSYGLAPPPKRSGSLSSTSALGMGDIHDTSPSNGDTFSSPEGTGQSEQLAFFKDYYSTDEIRPGALVSVLWAYAPRAADEFELERGDMLKVTGIWDDGWATGVRVQGSAEDWRDGGKVARDSGLSSGSASPETLGNGEVKAFPLVCVCVPGMWRKVIEGDETGDSGGVTHELEGDPPGRGA